MNWTGNILARIFICGTVGHKTTLKRDRKGELRWYCTTHDGWMT